MPQQRLYGASTDERLRFHTQQAESGCWEFTGWRSPTGYGKIKVDGGTAFAHRVAYETWVGPIPDGLSVCHRCDNPPCCNPDHLFLGTHQENMQDMASKGRRRGPSGPDPRISQRWRAWHAQRRQAEADAAGVPVDWKCCRKCDQFKPRASFAKNAARSDGLQVYCKDCWRVYSKERAA